MDGEDMGVEPAWFQAFTCFTRTWAELRPAIERSPYRCVSYRHAINVYYTVNRGRTGTAGDAALSSASLYD
jgi:hypothetical protein